MERGTWLDDDSGFWSEVSRWSNAHRLERIVEDVDVEHVVPDTRNENESDDMADSGRKDSTVVVLTKDNYTRWVIEIEAVLRSQGVWWHACGDEPAVAKPAPGASADAVKKYREWDREDSKARAGILRTLDDVTFSHVQDCRSSKAVLDRIRELRDPKSTDVLMTSLTSFFSESWSDSDDVTSFMAKLATHAGKVNACNESDSKVNDRFMMAKTLSSLPSSFSNFVQSWNLMATDDTTLATFREKLLAAERSMKGPHVSETTTGDALHVRERNRRGKQKGIKKSKADSECHYCRKTGHWKAECRKRMSDEKKAEAKSSEEGNACLVSDYAFSIHPANVSSHEIIADSGACRHMTGNRHWFLSLRRLESPIALRTADGVIHATHEGDIPVETSVDGKTWTRNTWKDVLFVPALRVTLYSTTFIERLGLGFRHENGQMLITKNEKPFISGRRNGSSYMPFIRVVVNEHNALVATSLDVWHQRLGHVSNDVVRTIEKNGCVDGLDVVSHERNDCDACHYGKQTRNVHRQRDKIRNCELGQRFHSDVCSATVKSLAGSTMFVTLKDEASGYRLIRFLKSKADVAAAMQSMLDEAKKQTGRDAISIRTDNGTEYVNSEVENLLTGRHELSPPYVKECNGLAERENRILCDTARSMLFNADLSTSERNFLWAEAVNTAAYIRNRLPNNRTGPTKTPYEMWFGNKPCVSHLRVFGSSAFVHNHDPKRKKFDAKSRKVVFVGYDNNTDKVFKIYDREKRSIERVSDVKIVENQHKSDPFVRRVPASTPRVPTNSEEEEEQHVADVEHEEPHETQHEDTEQCDDPDSFVDAECDLFTDDADNETPAQVDAEAEQQPKRGRGRPLGSKNKPKQLPLPHEMTTRTKAMSQNAMVVAMDPRDVTEAQLRVDAYEWRKAMEEEMKSLAKNETWTLVPLPPGLNVVTCKWVFKSKTKPDGTLDRRKARLVARGFSQTHGVDFFETFSPVVRYESVRCVLAYAASRNMFIRQFDVKTAFLYGPLDEEVYMQQPEGFEDGTNRVCRLRRSLYGLKQSPRNWNGRFSDFLVENGFRAIPEDTCVYIRKDGNDVTIVCLYVDDGLVCGSNNKEINAFIESLRNEFDVKVNEPNYYVGMELTRNANTISVSQSGYIARVLERFGMTDAKPLCSPMDPTVRLDDKDSKDVDVPYREAIGCLNYVSTISRPDITFAVNTLARYSGNPKAVHWNAIKRLLAYLKGTVNYAIVFGSHDSSLELHGSCDSDWGGEQEQRRSTSGYVFTLNGGPVAWSSRLQKTTALSVTEAEYMAMTEALCECLWLRPFLASIGIEQTEPTTIQADNRAAIALSKNPEFHKRTKHVGIRYHRIRQEQEQGVVIIDYVPTNENPADVFTKALTSKALSNSLRLLNMIV